jgi:N-carbamoylputrescine amidase
MNAASAKAAETGAATKRRSPVRVAVVQFNPQVGVGNLESNALAARQCLQQAAKAGANLIVLSELATTGYCFDSREEAFAHAEPVPGGPIIRGWIAFAKENKVYVVGCLPEVDRQQLFDTAVLVGPDGYVGKYRKTHLWNEEKLFFTPGNLGFPVFDTRIGRIALLVCWDIWFPETARIVSQLGADIVCIPTGCMDTAAALRCERDVHGGLSHDDRRSCQQRVHRNG